MSSEGNAVDAFSWIDAGTRWGVVAGGTAVVLVLVVIVLVLCMRTGGDSADGYEKSRSPYFQEKEHRPSISSYGGMVSVPIRDGTASMIAPPPYCSLTNTRQVQPGIDRISPHMFGVGTPYSPQILAPPPNGLKPHAVPPPPYDHNTLSPGLTDYSSSSEDEEEQMGKVWFTTRYDNNSQTLQVEVLKAKIHAVRDRNSTMAETFIKVNLLPDEKTTYRTKAKRKTMTPKYNEKFTFIVAPVDLHTHVLRLSACLTERSVTTCLGHVLTTLEDLDDGEVEVREFGPNPEPSLLGEINFSMSYHPQNEKLRLTFNKCRNLGKLPPLSEKESDLPSIYIKAQLICGRKQLDLQTTSVKPPDLDIEFNEKMTFTLTHKQMRTASLVVTIMRQRPEKLEAPFEEIYSSVTVGPYMFLHKEALRHWQEMLNYPRTRITHWHGLR